MPELPEVETVRRSLERSLVGARVERVLVKRRDVVTGGARQRDLLGGSVIQSLDRRGKQLAILAESGRCLTVHLGMSGRLTTYGGRSRADRRPAHTHLVWRLADAGELWFTDPRRFGGVWTHGSRDDLEAYRDARLGPDALGISAEELASALAGARTPVKAALLDQRRLAGVGNIYADEALHEAGIHPERHAGGLTAGEIERLSAAVRAVLARGIERGGSTIRDYRTPDGGSGGFLVANAVYGRGGEACRGCGQVLHISRVAGRTTVWCPRCQPESSALFTDEYEEKKRRRGDKPRRIVGKGAVNIH
jgi:formamidopyrimidine-DNA glycosylase